MRIVRPRDAGPLLLLILALGVGSALRLYSLSSRGLIYWDEAKFALEGVHLQSGLLALFGQHVYLGTGKAIGTAKPGHALLIALSYFVFGIHDYAPLLMNAGFSVAGIAFVYLIGRRLFGPLTGAVAALFAATSEYDVIYARSVLSESDALALLLASVLLCLQPGALPGVAGTFQRKLLLLAAMAAGAAFTVNYRSIVYIAILVAVDFVYAARRGAGRSLLTRVAIWIAGIAVFPAMWAVLGTAAQHEGFVIFANEFSGSPETYVHEVLFQLHGGKQSAVHFSVAPYWQWFRVREGWPIGIGVVVALAFALTRRTFQWIFPAAMILAPYAIYVFAPFDVPRNLLPSVPFAELILAAVLTRAARIRTAFAVVVALLAAVLLTASAGMAWRLTVERSGFAATAAYLASHHARAVTTSEIMVFYFRGNGPTCAAPAMPVTVEGLGPLVRIGYRFAVVERHNGSAVIRFLTRHAPLAATFEAFGPLNIGESPISSENANPPSSHFADEYVRVYDISPFARLGPRLSAAPCSRDRVA